MTDVQRGRRKARQFIEKLRREIARKGYRENMGCKEGRALIDYLETLDLTYLEKHTIRQEYERALAAL